jgi:HEAT repeat protein
MDCRLRAETALRALAGADVMPLLVQELLQDDPTRCEQAKELLCGLGSEPVVPLLEILRTSLDQSVRLTVVGVLAELGQREREAGATVPRTMVPLLRELRNADHNPWYFTRNVAEVLVRVGAPGYDRDLLAMLGSDLDYRVRAAVAQGLRDARSPEIQAALRQALFEGKIIVPEAFQEILGEQLAADREAVLRDLDGMLTTGAAPDRIERVALATLARQLGSEAIAFLGRVLNARSGLLRRPTYGEDLRLTAVEALATIPGEESRSLLEKACKDPSEEVRRRAALRLEQGPSSSPPGSSSQEVPWT